MTRPPAADLPPTLTDRARALSGQLTSRAGLTVHRLGIHPDAITIAGLIVVGAAAVLIGRGELQAGGLLMLVGLPLDALDGAVARAMKRQDQFGAVLDSSLDRYADGFIFAALSYHFAVLDQFDALLLALAGLLGTFQVSYVRARAEGVGLGVKIGLLSRFERAVILLLMLLAPDFLGLPILETGLWVLALGTNFTGLQRLWFVRRRLNKDKGS
jgi:CDP-diacylglycerol--glycerol-3-phosphate 3-phosphatidyltransferase